jgi:hypothetical protein
MTQFNKTHRLGRKLSTSMYGYGFLSYNISLGHISTSTCSLFIAKTNSSTLVIIQYKVQN